jgi:hypothetical protein
MAGNDQMDQDAIAAQWEASLDSEDPAAAAAEAAKNELTENMALQWAAMVEDGSRDFGGKSTNGERVLSQEEIDNLLGFTVGDVSLDDHSGIRAIIDSAMVSYERLPMLEIVFDRLVRLMTTSLRNFTSDNVEVSLDRITSVRFGDYMNSIPLPAVLSVFKAEEWENFGLATVDSSLIYSMIDVLRGGRRGQTQLRIEGRPYTTIETNLVKRLVEVVLSDAEQAFRPLSPVTFTIDRLETNPRFAAISRTRRSNTISSIGRRSYDTIAESMMARMPEFSSILSSPSLKPSRLSISSCDSTRSPPALPISRLRLPSSTIAAHCSAMVSVSVLASASAAAAAGSSESSAPSHSAASAS